MDEDELREILLTSFGGVRRGVEGPGDDCALVGVPDRGRHNVLKTDALVESVHFTRAMPGQQVGHKAIARVISDFAACGAVPRSILVGLGLPKSYDLKFLRACYRGMGKTARRFGVELVGGEMVQSTEHWFCISGLGEVKPRRFVGRDRAKSGDVLLVTGRLGGSFPKRHLVFEPRLEEGLWLAEQGCRAMMDLSDGLGRDLPRLASASGLSFSIEPKRLPRARGVSVEQAVNDGEDYELLVAVSKARSGRVLKEWPFKTRLTEIGFLLPAGNAPETGGIRFEGFDHLK